MIEDLALLEVIHFDHKESFYDLLMRSVSEVSSQRYAISIIHATVSNQIRCHFSQIFAILRSGTAAAK